MTYAALLTTLLCGSLLAPSTLERSSREPADCRLSAEAYANWTVYVDSMRRADLPPQVDREIEANPRILEVQTREGLIEFRLGITEQLKQNNNWTRTANYLWTDAGEAQRVVEEMGFASGYYFDMFLTDYPGHNPCREQILTNMRDSVFRYRQDSMVFRYHDRKLAAVAFRTFIDVRGLHKH